MPAKVSKFSPLGIVSHSQKNVKGLELEHWTWFYSWIANKLKYKVQHRDKIDIKCMLLAFIFSYSFLVSILTFYCIIKYILKKKQLYYL